MDSAVARPVSYNIQFIPSFREAGQSIQTIYVLLYACTHLYRHTVTHTQGHRETHNTLDTHTETFAATDIPTHTDIFRHTETKSQAHIQKQVDMHSYRHTYRCSHRNARAHTQAHTETQHRHIRTHVQAQTYRWIELERNVDAHMYNCLLRKVTVALCWPRNSPQFAEREGSLPYPQKPATTLCPEPVKFSVNTYCNVFFQD